MPNSNRLLIRRFMGLGSWVCAIVAALVLLIVGGIVQIFWEIGRPSAWVLRKIPLDFIQMHVNPSRWISAEISNIKTTPINYSQIYLEIPTQTNYENMTVNLISKLPFKIEFTSLLGHLLVNNHETNVVLLNKNDVILPKKSNKEIHWAILGSADNSVFLIRHNEKEWGIRDKYVVHFTGADDKGRKYNFNGMEVRNDTTKT